VRGEGGGGPVPHGVLPRVRHSVHRERAPRHEAGGEQQEAVTKRLGKVLGDGYVPPEHRVDEAQVCEVDKLRTEPYRAQPSIGTRRVRFVRGEGRGVST